jgi:hypothetical protein
MKYTQVKNPVWANAEHTLIQCEVDFDDLVEEFVPFGAVASGDYEHTHQIFAECVAGNYGSIAEYVPPAPYVPSPEILAAQANKQNALNKLMALGLTEQEALALGVK